MGGIKCTSSMLKSIGDICFGCSREVEERFYCICDLTVLLRFVSKWQHLRC